MPTCRAIRWWSRPRRTWWISTRPPANPSACRSPTRPTWCSSRAFPATSASSGTCRSAGGCPCTAPPPGAHILSALPAAEVQPASCAAPPCADSRRRRWWNPKRIFEHIEAARKAGYAWSDQECYRGDVTIAAPVIGDDGLPVGGREHIGAHQPLEALRPARALLAAAAGDGARRQRHRLTAASLTHCARASLPPADRAAAAPGRVDACGAGGLE